MNIRRSVALYLALVASLSGCAAPRAGAEGAAQTPYEKLSEARTLYQQKGDVKRSEALIHEAMATFTSDKDQKGLADAHQRYAYFLASDAVERERETFRRDGFLDKSVDWGNRLQKSIGYFDKAAPVYASLKRFDRLADNNLGRGIVYTILRNTDEACASFDQAASFREEALRVNPDAKISTPKEFKTWDDYVKSLKGWAGCR